MEGRGGEGRRGEERRGYFYLSESKNIQDLPHHSLLDIKKFDFEIPCKITLLLPRSHPIHNVNKRVVDRRERRRERRRTGRERRKKEGERGRGGEGERGRVDKNSICYLSRFALNSAGLNLAAFNSSFETGCAGRKKER